MDKGLKVFIACFIGAVIGTFTALRINGNFWWIGLVVGGLVGYLSYEFRAVLAACKNEWKECNDLLNEIHWKKMWIPVTGLLFIAANISISICLILFAMNTDIREFFENFAILTSVLFIFALTIYLLDGCKINFSQKDLISLNPFVFCFKNYFYRVPVNFFRFFVKSLKFIFEAAIFFLRFTKTVFILIHSDIRLLCGIDAAIGTFIGYFTGSVFVGGLAGGIFGVINYEVISKRVLCRVK